MRKSIKYLVLSIVIVALLISNVSAWADSAQVTNTGALIGQSDLKDTHPADSGSSAVAVKVTGTDYTLDVVTFSLAKYGSPTGTLRASLYSTAVDGTPDTLIESGGTKNIADLTTNPTFTAYNFSFTGLNTLAIGVNYSIVLSVESSLNIGASNYVRVGGTAVQPTLETREYNTGFWEAALATHDAYFVWYGSADTGDAGGGTGWTTEDTDDLIDNAMEFLVPLIVILLPAILFIIFFKRTDKWLILIGLAIGVGLGYYFFGIPVWLVFLIAIGLIGFAYSEVRRNG